ncbi:hypothetical protein N7527_005613 [Penicillium freii]|nr:hypothetical protein N7527_005613 [Penicillium freii]
MATYQGPKDKIPRDFDGWSLRAKELWVVHAHLSDPSTVSSASTITEEFISTRALWPNHFSISKFPFPNTKLPIEAELEDKAKRVLGKFTAFQRFLKHLCDQRHDMTNQKLRAFALVLDSHQQILHRHLNPPSSDSTSTKIFP